MSSRKAKRLIRGGRTGRRLYGGIYELADGREVYLAYRKIEEIFRSGEKSVSDAITKGTACWAMDHDTLIRMRTEGVKLVGVKVKETGDIFITTRDKFETEGKMMNYEARGGALQRYLPLSEFGISLGSARKKKSRNTSKSSSAISSK